MHPPEGELAGKVAIVTGAGQGIGRAIALALLEAGARVGCVGRQEAQLRQLVNGVRAGNARALALRADVSREADVRRMVRAVVRRFGPIDILVNNAGTAGPTVPAAKLSARAWRDVLESNLTGTFLCTRECLRSMTRRRQGRVINISSMAGRMAYPLRASYAAAKWGVIGFTKTLAVEVGPSNIQVNAICPGAVAGTPRIETVIARRARALKTSAEEVRRLFSRATALGRMVTIDDITRMVLFLCSDGAQNITGQAIEVSAGLGLWPGS